MSKTIDETQKKKWLDFVNKHKPTDLDIDPEACAQLLANQENAERGELPKRTFKDVIMDHFGKPAKRKKKR